MRNLKYTLLTDGSSDRTLMPIIEWLLNDLFEDIVVEGNHANSYGMKNLPKQGDITSRINLACDLYSCDMIFVHRDAEKKTIQDRESEILDGWIKCKYRDKVKIIPIIPVKMTEAWLLIDETAIRSAAGNRSTKVSITLPPISRLEDENDPKETLFALLKKASGLKGRSLEKLNVHAARHLVAERIGDYSKLRRLPSFQYFEVKVKETLAKL